MTTDSPAGQLAWLRPIAVARTQLHVREARTAPNDGAEIRAYQQTTGNEPPAAWCMAFVVWCHLQAKVGWPLRRSGRVQDVYKDALAKGWVHASPQTGDIGVLWYPKLGRFAHAFLVEAVNSTTKTLRTLEGNTSDPSASPDSPEAREGWGVFRREDRKMSARMKFIRIPAEAYQ
jgi:hypothetical protein